MDDNKNGNAKQKRKPFSKDDLFDLIFAIEERPGIWQKPSTYRTRKSLLNEIATKLNCTSSDIQKEWNTLSTNYHKERLRIKNVQKKHGAECRSNWKFYDVLHFLCKFSNNITENLKVTEGDTDEETAESNPLLAVSYENINQQQLSKIESSLANLFSNNPGKFSPEIDQIILSHAVDSFPDANCKGILKNSSGNHIDKILSNANKIFSDFVAQIIQDLNNEAQSTAKMEIQAILKKYCKPKTKMQIGNTDDNNVNKSNACETMRSVNSFNLMVDDYNSLKESNRRMNETYKRVNESIKKICGTAGNEEQFKNCNLNNTDVILTHEQKLQQNISTSSFYSVLS